MIETVKDVFEECLERLRYRPDNKGGIFDREAVELHDRFEAALAAETEAQKSCPYCHAAMGNKIVGKIVSYNDYNFCPMCGRRLEEK
jgi:RNA polymerase subunit RPABC4/transcription elongation factor Spt4